MTRKVKASIPFLAVRRQASGTCRRRPPANVPECSHWPWAAAKPRGGRGSFISFSFPGGRNRSPATKAERRAAQGGEQDARVDEKVKESRIIDQGRTDRILHCKVSEEIGYARRHEGAEKKGKNGPSALWVHAKARRAQRVRGTHEPQRLSDIFAPSRLRVKNRAVRPGAALSEECGRRPSAGGDGELSALSP